MESISKFLVRLAKWLERSIDTITDYRLFGDRADWAVGVRTYPTYGNAHEVRFRGRVLRDHSLSEPTVDDSWFKNLIRTFHAIESDEVPAATVELTFLDNRRVVQSDREGYIDEVFEITDKTISPGWQEIQCRIETLPYGRSNEITFIGYCLVPAEDHSFGIISDIDDTVLESSVTRPLQMLKLLIFTNAHTRLAVEGAPDLYRELAGGNRGDENNPVFYVSSSPWNLEPMLSAFIDAVGLPRGPMMLRDMGIGRDIDMGLSHGHKEVKIRRVMETFPSMKFVLLGDAGQEDAAIYSRICDDYGDQVIVAYIRQVGDMPSDRVVQAVAHGRDRGTPIFLLPGTTSIRADAVARGLIPDLAEQPKPMATTTS